ncbi:hypothetical protein EMIHUDRAFT_249340 [Emiliania huxleyi CCMP1516]|uniref:Uncharacterized protein n=2 Tax=Emiliania huxleyi TaxID=2903 RepID=A0A0D3I9B1_EMIH1|nr:hypothetical protein EMIHUDRAFT_249340 [Emiliania huxleyi CCMP1516]EOD07846.1 hypothetical protein EMIHUDRAFT_249340 [Emiliania huxleyi CCMP1516]|eukprot:XP_005760275.1 hypothetical protein EMIHUDRAFT_249340 [Emiliania huxleyi CCMP1516]
MPKRARTVKMPWSFTLGSEDEEDFDVGDDFLEQGTGALGAGGEASVLTTVLSSYKPAPPRPTKPMMLELKKMAAGELAGDEGSVLKLFGDNAQLSAENMLDKHVPNMCLLIAEVKKHGIGLREFVRDSTLFFDTMHYESSCFSEANFSMRPLLAACDAGESDIMLFLALCRLFRIGISHEALAGPPGRQANDSCAGASAVLGASKLALIKLVPSFEGGLAKRSLTFEQTYQLFNLLDTGDTCCRVNINDDINDDGKNCSSHIPQMAELNLELLLTLLGNDGVHVQTIVGFAASPRLVAARLADGSDDYYTPEADDGELGPSHIKYWRGTLEEILPEADALKVEIYNQLCALKLLDQPSLAPLPSHEDAREWEPSEEQCTAAAAAAAQRLWRRIAAQDARGKELVRLLQLHERWRAECECVQQRFAPAYQAEALEGEDGTALLLAQDGCYPPDDWHLRFEHACDWLELLEARHATLSAEFARLRDIALARPHQLNELRATLVLRHVDTGAEECVEMRERPSQQAGAGDWTQGWFQRHTPQEMRVPMSMNEVFVEGELVPRKSKTKPGKNQHKARVVSIDVL